MKRVLKMAVLHGLLASLGVAPGLWGLVILQPWFDPAQVAGKFGEHQTAAITVCGWWHQQPCQKHRPSIHRGNRRPQQQMATLPGLWHRTAVSCWELVILDLWTVFCSIWLPRNSILTVLGLILVLHSILVPQIFILPPRCSILLHAEHFVAEWMRGFQLTATLIQCHVD